jgi:hypothetical protein
MIAVTARRFPNSRTNVSVAPVISILSFGRRCPSVDRNTPGRSEGPERNLKRW